MWSSWWGGGEKGIPLDKSPKAVRVVPDLEAGGSPTSELPPLEAMEDVADDLENVTRASKDSKMQLDAARICQIENRLKNDPSLQIEKKPDGTPLWEFPDRCLGLFRCWGRWNCVSTTRQGVNSKPKSATARLQGLPLPVSVDMLKDLQPCWLMLQENPAEVVKKKLIRTYTKIRKSGLDMSMVTMHQLDDRVDTLKRL
eukprot:g23451.t1